MNTLPRPRYSARLRQALGFIHLKKAAFIITLGMYVAISQLMLLPQANAQLTPDQYNTFKSGIYYFDTEVCGDSGTTTGSGGTTTIKGTGAWNSKLQPPYYLEEFVINVLEDIATVAKVPQTDTVTQEHVVALVAWAWEEGGNITNNDAFNPWNTGLDRPDLIDGKPSDNGVQSFKSFNAGVTAATITMTGSLQNRIEKSLTDPNSTAEQFMQSLTYYQRYPGNKPWAQDDQNDQQGYLNKLMTILGQTRSDYNYRATTVIGKGEENTHHVPASKLQYKGGTGNITGGSPGGGSITGGLNCQSAVGQSANCQNNGQTITGTAAIACDVLNYDTLSYSQAWHSSGSSFHQRCDSTYGNNPPHKFDGHAVGPLCATDCSGLVDLALYDLFKNDMSENTTAMLADSTGPNSNFERIPFSKTQPGDLIFPESGHVEVIEQIYSHNPGGKMKTFAAHTDGIPQPDQVSYYDGYHDTPGYIYMRYKGKGAGGS